MNGLRSFLYAIAALLGDAQAIRRGPKAIQRRIVRRVAGRAVGQLFGRYLK